MCRCFKCGKIFNEYDFNIFLYPCRKSSKIVCDHCVRKYHIRIDDGLEGFDSEDENEIKYMNEHADDFMSFLCRRCEIKVMKEKIAEIHEGIVALRKEFKYL